jgi:hypothetical protein
LQAFPQNKTLGGFDDHESGMRETPIGRDACDKGNSLSPTRDRVLNVARLQVGWNLANFAACVCPVLMADFFHIENEVDRNIRGELTLTALIRLPRASAWCSVFGMASIAN